MFIKVYFYYPKSEQDTNGKWITSFYRSEVVLLNPGSIVYIEKCDGNIVLGSAKDYVSEFGQFYKIATTSTADLCHFLYVTSEEIDGMF